MDGATWWLRRPSPRSPPSAAVASTRCSRWWCSPRWSWWWSPPSGMGGRASADTGRPAREATGHVTGLLGEMFGGGAGGAGGARRAEHARPLPQAQRRCGGRDRCATGCSPQLLDSVFWNAVNIGTGLILHPRGPIDGRRHVHGVGDFALFVYFLGFDHRRGVHSSGVLLAQVTARPGGLFGRMVALLRRRRPEAWCSAAPAVPHRRPAASAARPAARPATGSRRSGCRRADLPYPDAARGVEDASVPAAPRLIHGDHRAHRGGQDDAVAHAARAAARPARRAVAGTASRWRSPATSSCRRAVGLHAPGAEPVQRVAARQHAAGPRRKRPRTCPRPCAGRLRARRTWRRWREGLDTMVGPRGVRLSGGQVQRPARRGCSCAPGRAAGVRRPLQRARRGDGANAVGARCSPSTPEPPPSWCPTGSRPCGAPTTSW